MTDKELTELRAFAVDAMVVIEWMIDTLAPPPPEFIERHLITMHTALERLKQEPRP